MIFLNSSAVILNGFNFHIAATYKQQTSCLFISQKFNCKCCNWNWANGCIQVYMRDFQLALTCFGLREWQPYKLSISMRCYFTEVKNVFILCFYLVFFSTLNVMNMALLRHRIYFNLLLYGMCSTANSLPSGFWDTHTENAQ